VLGAAVTTAAAADPALPDFCGSFGGENSRLKAHTTLFGLALLEAALCHFRR